MSAAKQFVDDATRLLADPSFATPVGEGYQERELVVAGEGSFVVRVNRHDRVELTALSQIAGTGLMRGDQFAAEPDRAVRLVVLGAASPRQQGGIRRTKPGEQGAQAA